MINKLTDFIFEGRSQKVQFIETVQVIDGVQCDVYSFSNDKTKDLGIIRISPGKKTPLQKVLKGDRTIEGFISGKGYLQITKENGELLKFQVDDKFKTGFSKDIKIDDLMQWHADSDSELTAYEICLPPYQEGRYENLQE